MALLHHHDLSHGAGAVICHCQLADRLPASSKAPESMPEIMPSVILTTHRHWIGEMNWAILHRPWILWRQPLEIPMKTSGK